MGTSGTGTTSTDTQLITQQHQGALSIFDMQPEELVNYARRIAKPLADIIDKQHLYVEIQGRRYVKCEGWQTLGTLVGVMPREREVRRLADESFEAHVDLVSVRTGIVIGGASALCSITEKRWSGADLYARRSMAITRAVGKAYRTAFAWIVILAGYEPTNAEEMPEAHHETKSDAYTGATEQQERIAEILRKKKIPEELWATINEKMMGRPGAELPKIIKEVTAAEQHQ